MNRLTINMGPKSQAHFTGLDEHDQPIEYGEITINTPDGTEVELTGLDNVETIEKRGSNLRLASRKSLTGGEPITITGDIRGATISVGKRVELGLHTYEA